MQLLHSIMTMSHYCVMALRSSCHGTAQSCRGISSWRLIRFQWTYILSSILSFKQRPINGWMKKCSSLATQVSWVANTLCDATWVESGQQRPPYNPWFDIHFTWLEKKRSNHFLGQILMVLHFMYTFVSFKAPGEKLKNKIQIKHYL